MDELLGLDDSIDARIDCSTCVSENRMDLEVRPSVGDRGCSSATRLLATMAIIELVTLCDRKVLRLWPNE